MLYLSKFLPNKCTLVKNSTLETELLLCCTRTHSPADIVERIQFLSQQQLNWEYILKMAEKHRIVPLLYHNLKLHSSQSLHLAILATLRRRFHENSRTNLLLTHELLRLLFLFEKKGIRVIPYKGTVLAAYVYGKVGFRQVWDIDLLVDEQDFPDSRALLLSEGYILKENFDREQSFIHPDKSIEVDLHWGFTPFYFPVNFNFTELWHKTQVLILLDTKIKSFCPEDLLLILCIQIAKDSWERRQHLEHLAKVCDIAELLRAYPLLNWTKVNNNAEHLGCLRILHFGLFLAKSLLQAEIPDTIWRDVMADSLAISLAYQICAELFGETDNAFVDPYNSLFDIKFRFKQLLFYLKMRERSEHWWHHFLEIAQTFRRQKVEGRRQKVERVKIEG